MASGLLLILAGEEAKNKEKYLGLDKEYKFEVLFGFSTDTHDILGLPPRPCLGGKGKVLLSLMGQAELEEKIKNEIKSFVGESIQKYPMYSSKTVKGKPLFAYARVGEEVEIPERKILIKKLTLLKVRKIDNKKLLGNIEKRIKKVKGDFRQEEILKIWKKELKEKGDYFIGSFKIRCSSGTYVRVVADTLGDRLKVLSLAYSIKRTKVGKYVI